MKPSQDKSRLRYVRVPQGSGPVCNLETWEMHWEKEGLFNEMVVRSGFEE